MTKLCLDTFENILIYKSLTDSGYLSAIADVVHPKFFKNKTIANIFKIITAFNEKRNKLPTNTEIKSYLTTEEQKQSFKKLIQSFADIDKNLDRDELYENTEQFLKEKAVYHTMLEVAEKVSEGIVDTGDILNQFEKSCNINLVTDLGLNVHKDIQAIIDDINTEDAFIPSRWPWLDEKLGGGFLETGKSMYIFAGETNIGKSIFLGNIASNIASQNKNVLLLTFEMSEMLYARRLCTHISKIPMQEMGINAGSLKHAIEHEPGQIFIKEFPPSTITPNQIKAFIKRFVDQGIKLDAIVIDYLNLIHSTIGNNSYERIKYVSEQIRALSYVFGCPVITASQLGRSAYGQENPGLDTISESVGSVMTADVVASIFQTDEDRELGLIRMGLMKNRYGMRGETKAMSIDYSTLTVSEADDIDLDDDNDETFNLMSSLANI